MRLLPILAAAILATSCKEAEKAEPSPPQEESSQHPWDWIPEDEALAAGRQSYLQECALCHDEGEEGAPALTKKAKWEERITRGEDALITNAIEGFIGDDGEMPARGDSQLTDAEIGNAVRYMIQAALRAPSP